MRIVGGQHRGRTLAAPRTRDIRPTSDRLRESLFNILVHAHGDPVTGARVLDLFAGTGALGLEAMSRGAAFALFVDEGAEARALIRENVATLGLGGTTQDLPPRCDQARRGASDRAVLAGLPRSALWPRPGRAGAASRRARAAGSRRDALIVVEEAADAAFAAPEGFTRDRAAALRRHGTRVPHCRCVMTHQQARRCDIAPPPTLRDHLSRQPLPARAALGTVWSGRATQVGEHSS